MIDGSAMCETTTKYKKSLTATALIRPNERPHQIHQSRQVPPQRRSHWQAMPPTQSPRKSMSNSVYCSMPSVYGASCATRHIKVCAVEYRKGCQYSGAISEAVIERYLLIHIRPLLEAHAASIRISNRQIIDYKSKIKSINAKLSRLKDLYIDGLIDKDTYKADHEKLHTELSNALQKSSQQTRIPRTVSRILADEDFLDTYATMPKVNIAFQYSRAMES